MVVELIHEEGQPNLRRGRYVTVLSRKATADNGYQQLMQAVMMDDDGMSYQYVPAPHRAPSELTGIILRVVAVEIPFVQCKVMIPTNGLQAGSLVTCDTREHTLGFISPNYVRTMLKEINGIKQSTPGT